MTRQLTAEVISRTVAASSLEWKLTNPLAFGLTTATPLQRAICRVADGVPLGDLADRKDVRDAIGDCSGLPLDRRPKEMCVVSAIRAGKSLITACAAVHMALTCDVSGLRPGETPRIPVVSLQKDLGEVIMGHLVGSITRSPLLRRFLISEPTSDGIVLRHPSGMPIEIQVAAGSRAGAALVARWLAGCIFDEFPRMVGGSDAVVNWDDQRNAIAGRIRPNCQIWHIGSPNAPYGPAYDLVTEHHRAPTVDLVVVRAAGPAMNPSHWTPEEMTDFKRRNPDAFRTDALAEFATAEEAMFSAGSVDACVRKAPLVIPRQDGHTYLAAMDPATRGNGWTLAIATKDPKGRIVVVRAEEWQGSHDEPLDPGEVLQQVADIVIGYGVTAILSDQVMGDALRTLARKVGLTLVQRTYAEKDRARKFLTIRTHLERRMIELPPLKAMRTDMLHVQKRPTPAGIGVRLPMTSDGRHCDWAPTLMLLLSALLPQAEERDPNAPVKLGEDPETKAMREAVLKRFQKRSEW